MIVTCEQCSTQFQLDDSKVPERGVRVRCSRCKHAFTVKPQTGAGDPVERAVQHAVDDAPDPAAEQASDSADITAPVDEPAEESDWEFNHELGAEAQGARQAAAPEAGPDLAQDTVDDLLAAPDLAQDTVDDLLAAPDLAQDTADDPLAAPDLARDTADDLLAAPDLAQDTADDLLAAPDLAQDTADDLLAAPDLAQDTADDLLAAPGTDFSQAAPGLDTGVDDDVDSLLAGGDDERSPLDEAPSGLALDSNSSVGSGELGEGALDADPLDTGSGLHGSIGDEPLAEDAGVGEPLSDAAPPESAPPPARPEAPPPQAQAAADGLGSPENWDFFDKDDASPAPRAGMKIALGRIGAAGARRPPVEVEAEPSQAAVWLERVVHGIGWTAVAVLALAGLYGGLGLGAAEESTLESAGPRSIAGLELSGVRGSWMDNAAAGPIYVISAQLRNAEAAWVTPGSRLAVQLLDERGGLIADEVAAVGTRLPVDQLRSARPDALRARLAADADALASTRLAPGRTQLVHAVLPGLPEAATHFEIVAVPVEQAPRSGARSETKPSEVRAPARQEPPPAFADPAS